VHLGLIPIWVDNEGKMKASIWQSTPTVKLIEQYPQLVVPIQHGTLHFRIDPRNSKDSSGEANEFFIDDDLTMGAQEAYRFARERILQGNNLLAKGGLYPRIFEAPHYEISASEQEAASSLFPIMHHALTYYSNDNVYAVLTPWFTNHLGTIYAPSSIGYIDLYNKMSVQEILYELDKLGKVIDDPVAVVFYHPFMMGVPERENDLKALVEGIQAQGYRFVSTFDSLAPANNVQPGVVYLGW
jgi:hypothetical protein